MDLWKRHQPGVWRVDKTPKLVLRNELRCGKC